MHKRKFLNILNILLILALLATSVVWTAGPAAAAGPNNGNGNGNGNGNSKLKDKVELFQQQKAAAANQKAVKAAVGVTAALAAPIIGTDGKMLVDYFGVANWANSPALTKFIDRLPGLGPASANLLGQYIPVAVKDNTTYLGSDYYEIAVVEYQEQLHSELPATTLRGYVQISTSVVPGAHVALTNPDGSAILMPNGSQAYGVDYPHYLGPAIVATGAPKAGDPGTPVRIKFYNLLPTGIAGDLFIPVDTTVMGAGMGPSMDGNGNPVDYTQNRATIHLHGNNTVWISDGTPHQWITPADEATPYPKGVSVAYVPDMWFDANGNTVPAGTPGATNNPGPGAMTFFYSNAMSARLQFYHDHAFGITRLNVYAGEAAGYVITDAVEQDLINGTNNSGVNPGLLKVLPDIGIPLIIQDKTFVDNVTIGATDPTWLDPLQTTFGTNPGTAVPGDLWYPHVYMPAQNPWDITGTNPYGRWMYGPWFYPPTANIDVGPVPNEYYDPVNAPWEPPERPGTPNPSMPGEGFMDTMMVNGTVYPYIDVDPKAYRFRVLNAANDRFLNLSLYQANPGIVGSITTTPGSGYTADPVVTIANAQGDTTGTGLTLYATTDTTPGSPTLGQVTFAIRTVGSNYTLPPVITVTRARGDTAGVGATATATLYTAPTEVGMVPVTGTNWLPPFDASGVPDPTMAGPDWIQIGTEGGFLPAPVVIPPHPIEWNTNPTLFNFGTVNAHSLLLAPAERGDVLVDFSAYAGKTLILYNDAPAAFPAPVPTYDYYTNDQDLTGNGGAPTTPPGVGPNTRTVMQIRVASVTNNQSRVVNTAPNAVSPGEAVNLSASVYQLPGLTKVQSAGLPVTFNYVLYKLETGTMSTGSSAVNTDALGNANLSLTAPMEKSVVLVDAIYGGSASLAASSDMNIVSVLPIVEARLTATATLGSVVFHLGDQYGNPLTNQTLTFLTTDGTLSAGSGTTNTLGDVAVALSNTPSAVVSASFGGYINPQGWAYQPTMARITTQTALTGDIQTRVVTTAPNIARPNEPFNLTASLYQLPATTKIQTAGLPVTFNYVMFLLESGTSQFGTITVNTDAAGNAVLPLVAPNESSVVLVDAIFLGSGNLLPSSNMKIVSAITIIGAKVTATSNLGSIIFHLADQFGVSIAGQTLTFLTTSGTLNVASGVTDASGNVAVTLSGTISAVVSGSFGGYISPQGWAYQPTLGRINVSTQSLLAGNPYDVSALNATFAKSGTKRGVFEISQDPIIIPQAAYNSAYGKTGVGTDTFPTAPIEEYVQVNTYSKTFKPIDANGSIQVDPVTLPIQAKGAHDEMGGVYDTGYGRMSGMLGLEIPATTSQIAQFIPYGYEAPPVDIMAGSVAGTLIGTLGDGTQIWNIIHNGVDSHPIHVHLFNAQLINRVGWDGVMLPPDPNELGWKETFRMNPLEQIIIALRPTLPTVAQIPFMEQVPNSVRLLNPALPEGALLDSPPPAGWFDPNGVAINSVTNHYVNFGWEYVYHCHILAHEEMDMMHATAFAVPPIAPSNLSRNVLNTPLRVVLNWSDNSRNETGWRIQRAVSSGGPWVTIATITSTTGPETSVTVTYTDESVVSGVTYYYRIMADNLVGDSTIPGFPTISVDSPPSGTVIAVVP